MDLAPIEAGSADVLNVLVQIPLPLWRSLAVDRGRTCLYLPELFSP